MYKTNLKSTIITNYFLKLLCIVLIIFSFINPSANASKINWIEISKTPNGIQSWDEDSLIKKDKGIIEISTKYLKINAINTNEIEENIYRMQINCKTDKYKDISVNGEKVSNAKWEDPNGDKLIIDAISKSCKTAFF